MNKQFAESYYGSDYLSTRINDRIAQGCRVISAFGDSHCCTVIYESSSLLKDCPFCGNEVGVYERGGYDDYETYWVIECDVCEAGMECFETREAAIDAWNRRATDAD